MNKPTLSPGFAVSTWSLHRLLGLAYRDADGGRAATPQWGPGEASLLEIPAQAARHGIEQLEICHFHIPSADPGYLADLRGALADAGVRCLTLLVDEGDITHPDESVRARQMDLMRRWLGVAGGVGALRARVIAGDAKPDADGDALRLSARNLRTLTDYAADRGVRIVVENWHALLDRPAEVLQLLDMLSGDIGLMLDFGNWHGARKYDDLPLIAHLAESTHAKGDFSSDGKLDTDDYGRCLQICRDAGFAGPHSLIYDAPGDEWAGIATLRDFISSSNGDPG